MSSPQLTRLRPTLADIMMDDVTPDAFARFDENDPDAADKLRLMLKCREEAPVWAPDKVGDLARKGEKEAAACEVRRRRAVWAVDFKRRYQPEVIEWIDTGHKREKPCAVLLLKPRESRGGPPLIAVAFRGSKTTQDYFITDASPRFVPLPEGATGRRRVGGRLLAAAGGERAALRHDGRVACLRGRARARLSAAEQHPGVGTACADADAGAGN